MKEPSRSIAENTSAGENIGELVIATDLNEEDVLTYTLGGIDAASFGIEAATGQLLTKSLLDYETKDTYAVIGLCVRRKRWHRLHQCYNICH